MRILIIEDDYGTRQFLLESLEAECFAVDCAEDGEQGLFMAKTNDYDLIILDNILPKKSGIVVCNELRKTGKNVPIIMLSIESHVDKKVALLECGADDYVTKPFAYKELLARIKAILRRPKIVSQDVLTIEDFTIDIPKQKAVRSGKDIYLTRKEFALVEYLMRHQGNVVSRSMIMEHVWNVDGDPFSNTIETHVLNIRKKIDKGCKKVLIQTIPGRGYMMEPVTSDDGQRAR